MPVLGKLQRPALLQFFVHGFIDHRHAAFAELAHDAEPVRHQLPGFDGVRRGRRLALLHGDGFHQLGLQRGIAIANRFDKRTLFFQTVQLGKETQQRRKPVVAHWGTRRFK